MSLEDEPNTVEEALHDADWIIAMQEELHNFSRNQLWTLEERPKDARVIGTKWVFQNKNGDQGKVVCNKARLVAKGFSQVEGLVFGETFAPVARLEAIRILLAYASSHDIKLFQMDVKSAFLNGYTNELVYVEQLLGILNANRKIRKRTDTDIAFTREYSRVSIFHGERECTN